MVDFPHDLGMRLECEAFVLHYSTSPGSLLWWDCYTRDDHFNARDLSGSWDAAILYLLVASVIRGEGGVFALTIELWVVRRHDDFFI